MKVQHYIFFFTAFILLFGCKSDRSTILINNDPVMPIISSIGESNKIEIVTWNIEHFPKADFTTEYVKTIIEGLDADIYMLQEIRSSTKFGLMLGEIDDYNFILQPTTTTLNLAIIYKSEIINIKSSGELITDDPYFFAGRPPLYVEMEWQNDGIYKDLTVINIHYKCCGNNSISYVQNNDGSWDDEYRRLKASEILEKHISGNLSDTNVIVAGDFNDAIDEVDSTNVFLAFLNKPTEYKFADMEIAISEEINWSWQGWGSPWPAIHFDHILINYNLFDEFDNLSVVDVIRLEEYFTDGVSEYNNNVSDHRPVYIKFTP